MSHQPGGSPESSRAQIKLGDAQSAAGASERQYVIEAPRRFRGQGQAETVIDQPCSIEATQRIDDGQLVTLLGHSERAPDLPLGHRVLTGGAQQQLKDGVLVTALVLRAGSWDCVI